MSISRLVVTAFPLLALLGCAAEQPGRVYGARCDATDECGCYDADGETADPDCGRPGSTVMACVQGQCSLECEFGEAGDLFCQASFTASSRCAFDGICGE